MSDAPATNRVPSLLSETLSWALNGPLIHPIRQFSNSVIIVAGPWLLSVVALAVVSIGMEPVIGRAAMESTRLTIIYALCLAPLVGGPVGAIAARLVRSAVEENDLHLVPDILLVSSLLVGLVALFMAAVLSIVMINDVEIALAFIVLTVSTGLLWNSLAILSALRKHAFLVMSFAYGTTVSVFAIFLLARSNLRIELLIWSFAGGTIACLALILARLLVGNSSSTGGITRAVGTLQRELAQRRLLVLGIVFAFCGVWVDKWVLWLGPLGMESSIGLLHFGTYDSVMFIAHLSIVPTFAAMHILHDGEITQSVKNFRSTLEQNANFSLLRAAVESLSVCVWGGIFTIIFVQATVTATLVLLTPILSNLMHFDFSQFLLLRVGLIAAFVHSIFYLSSAVLLLCNRHSLFCFVQFVFLLANLAFSTGFMLTVGPSAYGLLAGSLVASILSFIIAYRSLHRFDYISLVAENHSFYGESR